MMQVFLLSFGLLVVMFIAMSVGYWVKQKSIAGSCGGLGALGIEKACNCDNPCDSRLEKERKARAEKSRQAKEKSWKENQIL